MPYFDYLLSAIAKGNGTVEKSFGQHVHWGYWEHPEQAEQNADDFSGATENLSQLLCNSAKITDGLTVLDVGCGFGGTIAAINKQYQSMDLTGLNIDERQLVRAREQVVPQASNTIKFDQGDACVLPYADNSFDVVLAVECIFHFPSREQFFKEAYRVLKPGGYLALSDFLLSKNLSKFHQLRVCQYLTNGFFGSCNVQYNQKDYARLAKAENFSIATENNITKNTLPTYSYLKSLVYTPKSNRLTSMGIYFTLLSLEFLSKIHALEYFVYAFKKPAAD